jgi:hemolysin III
MENASKPRLRGVSHHFAFFAALGAGAVLVAMSASARAAGASAVYAITLAAMFGVSATYHRIDWGPTAERLWRRVDHSAIFLVIAGTYTPVCLLAIGGNLGPRLLALVWVGAALGTLQSMLWPHAPRAIAVALYCALGWLIVAYFGEVRAALGAAPMLLLFGGGVMYTTGALVYALQRPDPRPAVFGYHEIFHVLVIAASICHFAAIALLVRGAP